MSASDLFGVCCRHWSQFRRGHSPYNDLCYCTLLYEDAMLRTEENDQRYLHS